MDFEEIYYLYFREVFLYIGSLSGDEIIAEEIAQEVFFKALKSINSFDGSKDIRAWLFTIAKNTHECFISKVVKRRIKLQLISSTISKCEKMQYKFAKGTSFIFVLTKYTKGS